MATGDPIPNRQDRNVEEPGDTNAADIVGRTGEEMPTQSHDGVDDEDRTPPPADAGDDDDHEAPSGHPI